MKILIGSSAPPDRGSGIGNFAKELSEALLAKKHSIHYLSPPPEDKSWLEEHGITHVSSDQYDDPIIRCRELVAYFKENNIEGAINNDNPFLQSIAPALNCPLVVIGHMDRKSVATLACYGWQWIDYVVAISYDMHRRFVDKYGVPVNRCPIIYNGVKDRHNKPNVSSGFNNRLRVIYAGGYSRNKGASILLQLISKNPELWDKIELHWFGVCRPSTKKKLALFPFVKVHGRVPRDEFLKSLSYSDILLLPSRYEGCPMVLLEAMSFGVIPISSDGHGAMREIIEHGISGYICTLANWAIETNECLNYLYMNKQLTANMKKTARLRYTCSFDINVTAQRIMWLINNPSVDRNRKAVQLDVLRWHRPLRWDGIKAPVIDRICINLGFLRKKGILSN